MMYFSAPEDVGELFDDWTHFETVLRLFRFHNQTEGDAYLHSHYPVFYLKGDLDKASRRWQKDSLQMNKYTLED